MANFRTYTAIDIFIQSRQFSFISSIRVLGGPVLKNG